uniref:MADS-box domain-containing protein n=1 Tax=Kalanchoe fedtschenkoi TaxID=63787 RepID=A0A7N0T7Z5_KALFE
MTRKKVKLAFIANDSARKATYKKRKRGLMKKVNELSTLCGIDSCAVIYSPYEAQPEVWPANPMSILGQFKKMPEMEQSKKMVNQESFLRQRIAKAKDQLRRQLKENREKEMTELMFQCLIGKEVHSLGMVDLNDLGWVIDQYLKDVWNRIEAIKKDPAKAAGLPAGQVACLDVSREEKPFGAVQHHQLPQLQWCSTFLTAGSAKQPQFGGAVGDPMTMMAGYGSGGHADPGGAWTSNPYSYILDSKKWE